MYQKIILFMLSFIFQGQIHLIANSKNILPIPKPNTEIIPLLEQVLNSPQIDRLTSLEQAEELTSKTAHIEEEFERAGKEKKVAVQNNLANKLLESHLSLAYFFEARKKAWNQQNNFRNLQERQYKHLKQVINFANIVKNISKNPQQQTLALYYLQASKFTLNPSDIGHLYPLFPLLEQKSNLTPILKNRIFFLKTVNDFINNPKANAKNIEKFLQSSEEITSIMTRLVVGRHLAGIDGFGKKIATANEAYKKILYTSTDSLRTLEYLDQEKIAGFILGVWRQSIPPRAPWQNPPLNFAKFNKINTLVPAFKEQQALWAIGNKNLPLATATYKEIAGDVKNTSYIMDIDQRILELDEAIYLSTKKWQNFEKTLLVLRNKYDTQTKQSDEEKKLSEKVKNTHFKLTTTILKQSHTNKTATKDQLESINLALRFINEEKDEKLLSSIKLLLAQLYKNTNQEPKAVDIYVQLAKKSQNKEKLELLWLAIESQHKIASWPKIAPWTDFNKFKDKQLLVLLSLYNDLQQNMKEKEDWRVVSHLGLLNLNQNNIAKAFDLWISASKKHPQTKESAFASGIMISFHHKSKNWPQLEDSSRVAFEHKIKPVVGSTTIKAEDFLSLALLELGKDFYNKKNYSAAIKKLYEFSTKFQDKNKDYGIFLLANAYKASEEHSKALDVLYKFVSAFPQSSYIRQALLSGGDWSMDMANEDHMMYFYQGFLEKFPQDKEYIKIGLTLSEIMIGKALYPEALKLLKSLELKTNQNAEKLMILSLIIDFDYENNFKKDTITAANKILTIPSTIELKCKATSILARDAFQQRNLNTLANLEKSTLKLGTTPIVNETVGEIRFYFAESKLGPMLKSINGPEVKDPIQSVFDRYQVFLTSKKDFDFVCSIPNSHCGIASFRMARLAERLHRHILDFKIPATIEESAINKFVVQQKNILQYLTQLIASSDEKSYSNLSKGNTIPQWTQHILWQSKNDWNFGWVSGESSVGFLQWHMYE